VVEPLESKLLVVRVLVVRAPPAPVVKKRLVELAVVLKKLVVVALVSAAEFAERTPKVAEVEYKFVLVAVVK